MTWSTRIKLLSGTLAVLVVVAALTLVMNRRITQAASETATIRAVQVDVGTDYAGTVSEYLVAEGDIVTAGQPVAVLHSLQLLKDIEAEVIGSTESPAYTLGKDGSMTFLAPVDGAVTELGAATGEFVQYSQVLATLERSGSLFVDARLNLEPRDYARVDQGAEVTVRLPDGTEVAGTVGDIAVETAEDLAVATVEVESDKLAALAGTEPLVAEGTPVDVSIELVDNGPLAGVQDTFDDFLTKVGL